MNKTHIAIGVIAVLIGAGWWYLAIDSSGVEPEPVNTSPTSADNAPTGSLHNLPVPDAVSNARQLASELSGAPLGESIVMSAYEKEWPNGCLGLPEADEFCTQAITPGYEVTVEASGETYVFRTNQDGSVIRRER